MKVDIDKGLIDEGVKALRIGDIEKAAHKFHQVYKKLIDDAFIGGALEGSELEIIFFEPVYYTTEGTPIILSYVEHGDEGEYDEDSPSLYVAMADAIVDKLIERNEIFCHIRCSETRHIETDERTGGMIKTDAIDGKTDRSYTKVELYRMMDDKIRWKIIMDRWFEGVK